MEENIDRKPTGILVSNGEIYEGDVVQYEDGYLYFIAKVENYNGVIGFFMENQFYDLKEFIHDFTLFPDENDLGAGMDFEIIKEG